MSKVGDGVNVGRGDWKFSGSVVEKFDEHVSKSVPLYKEGHTIICDFSDYFLKSGSKCLELGCSTGELTLRLAEHHKDNDALFTGIDIETDMIRHAKEKLKQSPNKNVQFHCQDIIETDFGTVDVVVAYYTLQFISPAFRQILVNKIYQSLNWGGAFFLFEKVRGADARFQDYLTGTYNEYKLRQGYSVDEIFGKTRSLKGVMEPFSTKGNTDLLERAGFQDINTIQKYICFEGICAIK
jgi:tRNA (cmo5U34)-methyltransferase